MKLTKATIAKSSLAMAGLLAFSAAANENQAPRPNIVHIMVDDLGWRDLSIYGSETFHTPHIDALAARGVRFSNAYASSPLCSPTRASTLTGQAVGRLRFTSPTGHIAQVILDPQEKETGAPGYPMTNPQTRSRLPLESVTISQVLKDNGYRTAFMGKWHLGHDPYLPENFGFDVVIGGRGTPGPPQSRFFGPWNEEANLPPVEGSPNVDDVLGDEAVRFIAERTDNPFFLALWLYNVHAPFQGKPEDIESYRPFAESAWYQRSAIMASMVKTLDDNVGKVMAELERQGLLENTIVIFTSDNGGNMYDRPEGENPTNNYPLRAGKGNNYEGGIRVPLIVSWPQEIAFNTVSNAGYISYDFFPTVLDILDIPAPDGWPLDGKSALPAWRNEPFDRGPVFTVFPHTVLATGNVANVAMIDGKWKLMRFFNTGVDQHDEYELYDLSIDPGETRNLSSAYPGLTGQMAAELARHLGETATLLPRKNPNYDADLVLGGFQMVKGGYLAGGDQTSATVTANDHRVTLRYHVSEQTSAGNVLEFDFLSNCVVGITAGPGTLPVFGNPVLTIPNLESRKIRVPLNAEVSDGVVTVVLDLEQPGRMHFSEPKLVMD
tara:strand:+ start:62047 stop:63867 length:1821 start_codon:yes stop_codon:yes gene_type:complete